MSVGGFIGRRAVVWRVRSGRSIAVARRVMTARLMWPAAIGQGMSAAGHVGSAIMRRLDGLSARLPATRHIT